MSTKLTIKPRRPTHSNSSSEDSRIRGEVHSRRIGKKKAAIAVGHSILVICWHLLTNNCDYADLGGDYFKRPANTDHRKNQLIQQLLDLGYQVTLNKAA